MHGADLALVGEVPGEGEHGGSHSSGLTFAEFRRDTALEHSHFTFGNRSHG